jgi:hypothetical protein
MPGSRLAQVVMAIVAILVILSLIVTAVRFPL